VNTKYQIFVSSTFDDLKSERQQVVKAILEMGHIPVGMEMFSAADDEQWQIISRQIALTDYYVVIIAHRYGSTEAGLSFTEKEYDFAVRTGVPVLGFIITDDAPWPQDDVDTNATTRESLAKFKEKVKKKYVSFWSNAHDLYGAVPIALLKQMNTNPRIGWIRANEVAGPEATAELARLSRENSVLRSKLDAFKKNAADEQQAQREQTIRVLRTNKIPIHFWYYEAKDWSEPKSISLYQIFLLLGPDLMVEKSTAAGLEDLAEMLNLQFEKKPLRSSYPIPTNTFQGILADFTTLGLIKPSSRKHLAKDLNEYWALSQTGRDLLIEIRRANLEAGMGEAEEASKKTVDARRIVRTGAVRRKPRSDSSSSKLTTDKK
jgi:hypothetical protein